MGTERDVRRRVVNVLMVSGAAIGLALGTGGCSVSFWVKPASATPAVHSPVPSKPAVRSVSGYEVARLVSERLTQAVGRSPDSVTCPGDLPATQGAHIRCQLRDGSRTYG